MNANLIRKINDFKKDALKVERFEKKFEI